MQRESLLRIAMGPFLGLCFLLLSVVPAVQAATIILYPTADTFANSQAPDTPQGGQAGLVTGTSESNNHLWLTYLMFDLSAVGGAEITSASLWLYQVDGYAPWGSAGASVSRISDNTWTEAGLTWNNQPNYYGPAWPFGVNSDDGLYRGWSVWTWTPTTGDTTLDPTPADAILSLFLKETQATTQDHTWLSREYASYPGATGLYGTGKEPYLVLTTSDAEVPEPMTLFLTGAALAGFWLARRRHR